MDPVPPIVKRRPPLGLPHGSVRAILTILVVAVVLVEVIRGKPVELLWSETLMIVLAHYFSSRRFIHLSPDVIRRLEREGHLESEPRPLYLPRGTIRVLLIAAFVGLAVNLYARNELFQPKALSILGVVFAYLLGVFVQSLIRWWSKGHQTPAIAGWEHLKASVVLSVLLYTAGAYLLDHEEFVPRHLRQATLGLVLFYFGSR